MIAYVLSNGNMVVPNRAESDGIIGDGMIVISQNNPLFQKWLPYARPATPEIESIFGSMIAEG